MIPENSGSLAHSYVHEHLDTNHCECQVLEAVIAHNDVGGEVSWQVSNAGMEHDLKLIPSPSIFIGEFQVNKYL
jgi:hypothetical protein